MALFKQKPKSAQQKAQRTQMRVFVRLACCAYIVFYVIIPMLKPPETEETMDPRLRLGIVIAFIAVVAFIVVITIREIIIYWKAGYFKASAYTDDPEIAGALDSDDDSSPEDDN